MATVSCRAIKTALLCIRLPATAAHGAKRPVVAKLTSASKAAEVAARFVGALSVKRAACAALFNVCHKFKIAERLVRVAPSRNSIGEAKWNALKLESSIEYRGLSGRVYYFGP
jgi:hypothetical protein